VKTIVRSIAVLLAAVAESAAAQSILAGEWQIRLAQTDVPGGQAVVATQCVSATQAQDPAVIAQRVRPRADCIVTTRPSGEGEYGWTFECPQSGMRGRGRMHYTSSAMQGEIHSTTPMGGAAIDMTQRITAKRVGPCGR
jgi:hypothetical protein